MRSCILNESLFNCSVSGSGLTNIFNAILSRRIGLQHGGVVTRPTQALIGEHGPEAVIPLSRGGPLDNSALIKEVQGLRAEVRQLRAEQGGTVQFKGRLVVGGREMGEFVTETVEYSRARRQATDRGRL